MGLLGDLLQMNKGPGKRAEERKKEKGVEINKNENQ